MKNIFLSPFEIKNAAFSLIEGLVAIGIGSLVIYGSSKFITVYKETTTKNKEQREEREYLLQGVSAYQTKSLTNAFKEMGISTHVFKMPIIYKTTNICSKVPGGCFMMMNNKEIKAIPPGTIITPSNSSGTLSVNFFKEERGEISGGIPKKVKSCCSVPKLAVPKYTSKVMSSKEDRYFVGWTLLGDKNTDFPFWALAEDPDLDHSFELNSMNTINKKQDPMPANLKTAAENCAFVTATGNIIQSKYENRFYLNYHPKETSFAFISYIESIQYISDPCSISISGSTKGCTQAQAQALAKALSWDKDAPTCSSETKPNHLYLISLKSITNVQWSPFATSGTDLNNKFNVKNLSEDGFWPKQKINESKPSSSSSNPITPFVAFKSPGIDLYLPPNATTSQDKQNKELKLERFGYGMSPLPPHYLANIFSENGSTSEDIWTLQESLTMIPIKLHKFTLEEKPPIPDKPKEYKFMHTEYTSCPPLKQDCEPKTKPKKLMDIRDNGYVIFARQLGTKRFFTFVHNPPKPP